MKRKHLFASAVMAAVLAGCSQDELTGLENNLQGLGERPMVEAPVLTTGGVYSRMSAEEVSANGFANVEWEAGDGFGAAVMDVYNGSSYTKFEEKFTIVDYINSNVLFKTEDGKNFYADASMPQGNHLFYAPFNVDNISREPLATQLPLNQVVVPTTNGMPSNSTIAAFYEDNTSPVFVAYDIVDDTPKTQLDLQMRHIYSLPLVTLELGNVQLLGEDGKLKNDGAKPTANPVYEDNITINAIKFVQNETHTPNIVTKGYIKNAEVAKLLKKTEDGVIWDDKMYEDAATSDIVAPVDKTKDVTPYETITVTFENGINITKANPAQFFMVLPGATYTADQLAVYVYATINGESYISASKSDSSNPSTVKPFRGAHLLPGLPYAADEYNAEGDKKATAGTSMTYTISGGFIPTINVETNGYVEIKTYSDLVDYVTEMAYRGETLKQITKDEAIEMIETKGIGQEEGQYDPKKYFVITAGAESPIALDNDFIATFEKECVITNKNAKIEFISGKNIVLGEVTWTEEAEKLFSFGDVAYAYGNVTLKAAPAETVNLLSTANVTLNEAMKSSVTITNTENGVVDLNSALAHKIWNDYGTLNVNVSTAAKIWNGKSVQAEDDNSKGVMVIADGVETTGAVYNRLTGETEINDAVVAMENDGKATMKIASAQLTINNGKGEVNNNVGAKVVNETNVVYAEVATLNLANKYDKHTGLNKLVVNAVLTSDVFALDDDLASVTSIKTIDFIEGSGINFADRAGKDLDLTKYGVEEINIKANVTWKGRDFETSSVKAKRIVEAEDCKLTINNITINGVADEETGGYESMIIKTEGIGIAIVEESKTTTNGSEEYFEDGPTETAFISDCKIEADVAISKSDNKYATVLKDCEIVANTVIKVTGNCGVIIVDGGKFTIPADGLLVDAEEGNTQVFLTGSITINGQTMKSTADLKPYISGTWYEYTSEI